MKDSRNDSYSRLIHIQKSINEIEIFTKQESEKTFVNNNLLHSGVLFQFSVIGEAIIHIDTNILDKYEYQWYIVRALRNLISHEYFNIKLEAVWKIIINDLPELKKTIKTIIKEEFNS